MSSKGRVVDSMHALVNGAWRVRLVMKNAENADFSYKNRTELVRFFV